MFTLIIEDRSGNIIDELKFDQGSYSIGRVEGNDIILPSNSVSRTHARIFVAQGRCYVDDLDSSNGVIVDGERISTRTELQNATRIQVGEFTFFLEQARQAAQGAASGAHTFIMTDDERVCKLVRVGDMFAGEEFGLTEENNSIGRTDENYILLSDASISRKHAAIHRREDRFFVEDLGSSNGTLHNGKAVKSPTQVQPGDEVQFGNVRFVVAKGNQTVNVSAYSKPQHRNQGTTLVLGIVVVLLLGVGIALSIYFLAFKDGSSSSSKKTTQASADVGATAAVEDIRDTVEEDLNKAIDELTREVKTLLKQRNPDKAISRIQQLDLKSDHPRYKEIEDLTTASRSMSSNVRLLDRGLSALREKDFAKARNFLESIQGDSLLFEEAQQALEKVTEGIATKQLTDAKAACLTNIDEACIKQLCAVFETQKGHAETLTILNNYVASPSFAKPKAKARRLLRKQLDECIASQAPVEPETTPEKKSK